MTNLRNTVFKNPIHWLAFGGGAGLSPFAPGTMGSLVALPALWLCQGLSFGIYVALVLLLTVMAVVICHQSSRLLGAHDHPGIVLDEIVGMFIVFLWIPIDVINLLWGFLAFRVFDITKPWPIGWLDKQVSGGIGIVLDDVIAGLYAGLLIKVVYSLL